MQSARLFCKRTAAQHTKPEGVANCATEENVVPSGLIRLRFTVLHFVAFIKQMPAELECK